MRRERGSVKRKKRKRRERKEEGEIGGVGSVLLLIGRNLHLEVLKEVDWAARGLGHCFQQRRVLRGGIVAYWLGQLS